MTTQRNKRDRCAEHQAGRWSMSRSWRSFGDQADSRLVDSKYIAIVHACIPGFGLNRSALSYIIPKGRHPLRRSPRPGSAPARYACESAPP